MPLLTTKEARALFCPYSMATPKGPSSTSAVFHTCKTTDCMAWNWYDGTSVHVRTEIGLKPKGEEWEMVGHKDGLSDHSVHRMRVWKKPGDPVDRRGFCAPSKLARLPTHSPVR